MGGGGLLSAFARDAGREKMGTYMKPAPPVIMMLFTSGWGSNLVVPLKMGLSCHSAPGRAGSWISGTVHDFSWTYSAHALLGRLCT